MRPEPGELIRFRGHPCWQALARFYLKGTLAATLLGGLVGAFTADGAARVQVSIVAITVIACLALLLGIGWLRRMRITYTITSRRLVIETGLLSRRRQETPLGDVEHVGTRQSLAGKLLGVGSVEFGVTGALGYGLAFDGIADPAAVAAAVSTPLPRVR